MFMKEIGKMIKKTEKENQQKLMGMFMKEIGKIINKKEKGK